MSVAEANAGAVVVTRDGDKLAPTGWRVGAADDVGSIEIIEKTQQEVATSAQQLKDIDEQVEAQRRALVSARARLADLNTSLDRQIKAVDAASDRVTNAINDRRANGK
jgi:chromosome segregation ATPase